MKDITGFEGLYAVTEDGDVWSHPKNGREGLWLRPAVTSKGYLRVCLATTNGRRLNCRVHRLVALTFIPNPDSLPEVNHRNGIKAENRKSNLEWSTTAQNAQHAFATGLRNPNTQPQIEARRRNQKLAVAGWKRVAQARRQS